MFRRSNRSFRTNVSRHSRRAFKSILRSNRSDAQWMKRYRERQDRHARYHKAFRFVPLNFSRFKSMMAVFVGMLSQLSNVQPRTLHCNRDGMLGFSGGKRRRKKRRKKLRSRDGGDAKSYESLEPRQLLAGDLDLDFSGLSGTALPAALQDATADRSNFTTDNDNVAFTGNADPGRDYVRTIDNDYLASDFTAEITITVVGEASDGGATIGFFGIGNGVAGGAHAEPSGPSIHFRTHSTVSDFNNVGLIDSDGDSSSAGNLPLGNGTHRLRIVWDASTEIFTFSVDEDNTGSFGEPLTSAAPGGLGDTNSHIFFGGSRNISFDDLLVQVGDAPSDTTPPTIAISAIDTNLKAGETSVVNFTLSENSDNFEAGDVSVSGGSLSDFTGLGSNYSATFTPTPNSDTSGSVSVGNSAFTDAAGNANVDGEDPSNTVDFEIDTVAPTVTISSNETNSAANGDFTLTFAFSEAVNGFTADNIALSGGTKGTFTGGNGASVFTLVVTPPANSITPITVDVAADLATDIAGNNNAAAIQFSQAIDTVAPTVTISSNETDPAANGDFTLTFAFSEAVNGFTANDIALSGGMKGAFTGGDGASVFTLVVTPPTNSTTSITVDVAADLATDIAGNGNAAANQFSQAIDTVTPSTVMISNSTIDENTDTTSGNVAIGDLSASEAVAFALVAGTGDTDNARFTIDEGELQILQDQVVDHEVQDSYSVLVQATDAAGNSSTEVLTITVNDLAEQVVLDASVFAAAGGLVTIRLAGDQIEFVDDEGDSVSPSHDADKVTSISATGRSGADDTLVVDVNGLGDLPVSFEGGTGGNDGLSLIHI